MITSHIDLGQLIIAGLIAIVGWFVKKEITSFGKRLDKHEEVIMSLTGRMSTIVGELSIMTRVMFGKDKL